LRKSLKGYREVIFLLAGCLLRSEHQQFFGNYLFRSWTFEHLQRVNGGSTAIARKMSELVSAKSRQKIAASEAKTPSKVKLIVYGGVKQ
jgi:hypothetical protein